MMKDSGGIVKVLSFLGKSDRNNIRDMIKVTMILRQLWQSGYRFIYVGLMIFAVLGRGNAQDIKWGGSVESGIKADFGDSVKDADGNNEIRVRASNDDGVDGVRATLNASVYSENRGVKIGTRAEYSDQSDGSGTIIRIYNAYGWLNFFNGMISVKAGLIDDSVWVSPGGGDYHYSTNKGIRIETIPIENLNVGVFFNYGGYNFGPVTLSQWIRETAFGANYSWNKFYFAAGLKLASDRTPGNEDRARTYFGFRYWGIPNFSVGMDGQFENLGNFYRKGFLTMNERVTYRIKTLGFGVTFTQVVLGKKDNEHGKEKHPFYLKCSPSVEYGFNRFFRGGIETPFDFQDEDGIKFRILTINPWLYYSIGGAWIKFSYVATYITQDFNGGKAILNHKIAIAFAYFF